MQSKPTYQVAYGSLQIDFLVNYSSRKTLGIYVHPDLSVEVKAPSLASIDAIKSKVLKRASWILKQQRYFDGFLPKIPSRTYVSGETHYYLGRQYRLKLTTGTPTQVKLIGKYFQVQIGQQDKPETVKKLMDAWYRKQAKRKFKEFLDECLPLFSRFSIPKPELLIKNMPKRWGSWTPAGRIYLNPKLVLAPRRCIEYVIIHELCHFVVPRHNQQFYGLLVKVMPDWKRWKLRLEQVGG